MNYKIVVDSCCDLTPELKANEHISVVPLTLIVDGYSIVDDDTFDQVDFLRRVKESKECPKSACPSPQRYMDEFSDADTDIYVVTLSSELSGSYNSAKLGRDLYIEEGGKNNVHIFDSWAATAGQVAIMLHLKELLEAGLGFEEVITNMDAYIPEARTYFVLESLETLRKNGRLTNLQAIIANALNIKPIMSAEHGKIIKLDQTRGMNKALGKMVEVIREKTRNPEHKELVITHCNCYERAVWVKEKLESVMSLKNITIIDTAGVSSLYANEGGIVVGV